MTMKKSLRIKSNFHSKCTIVANDQIILGLAARGSLMSLVGRFPLPAQIPAQFQQCIIYQCNVKDKFLSSTAALTAMFSAGTAAG